MNPKKISKPTNIQAIPALIPKRKVLISLKKNIRSLFMCSPHFFYHLSLSLLKSLHGEPKHVPRVKVFGSKIEGA